MRLALSLLVLAAAACGPERRPAEFMKPCRVPDIGRAAECGTVEVPERRDREGAHIALRVVRLKAHGTVAAEPLFLLAGGPGQAASEAFASLLPFLEEVVRERDVVMVDQRGTGSSAPIDCAAPAGVAELLRPDVLAQLAERCAPGIERDVGAYLTNDAADDLDSVRQALGYARIDLLGASYGTRLALAYARRHPESTHALMLDGVAPPWMAIPESFAADGQRALDAMLARCEASACGRAFPDLKSDLDTLLTSLAEEPQQVELMHPRSGEPLSFELTRGGFARELRLLLYAPEIVALLPYTLARAKKGDYAPFVAQTVLVEETAAENMSFGLLLTVVCSEDVPRIVAPPDGGGFLGTVTVEAFRKACAAWPSAAVPQSFYERVPLDVPALLLSGELDPVTPPRWADDVLRDLPRGRHLVVPGMGHGVSVRSCVPRLLRKFLQAPEDVATLDASCLADEAPPFFIHAAGPPP